MSDDIRTRMIELLPRLRRFAYALTGDRDKVDDLVQETCVRALLNSDQWKPGSRLDSWMYRIAQNISRDQRRSSKVRGDVIDIETVTDLAGADGRDVAESQIMLQAVARCIAKLPEEQQLVLALVCLDGFTYKEAAEALGVPIGTIMSRLARARQTLNEEMPDCVKPS